MKLWKKLAGIVPMALTVGLLAALALGDREVTASALAALTPKDPVLAAAVLWLLYACKSLTVVFPMAVLKIAATLLFPLPVALAVNLVGVAVTCSVPYWWARLSLRDGVASLAEKHPALGKVTELRVGGDFFFSFLSRVVGLFSCDIVSMYMGAAGLAYGPYLAGAVLGFAPQTVCMTLLGDTVTEPGSPQFWLSLAAMAATTVVTVGGYGLWRWKKGEKAG